MRLMEVGGRKTKEQLVLITAEDFEDEVEQPQPPGGGGAGDYGNYGGGGPEDFEEAPPQLPS